VTRALIILVAVLAVACTPTGVKDADISASAVPVVWPVPPEEPRIRYLYSFREPRIRYLYSFREPTDLGIKRGAFSRFLQVFTGRESQRMLRPYSIAADDDIIVIVDPGLKVVHLYMTKQKKYAVISSADGEKVLFPRSGSA